MNTRCRRIWWWLTGFYLGTFFYAELRGYRVGCHRTWCREYRELTRWHKLALLPFPLAGAVMAWHLARVKPFDIAVCQDDQP